MEVSVLPGESFTDGRAQLEDLLRPSETVHFRLALSQKSSRSKQVRLMRS
jgi:hypothetical protein